MSQMTSVVAGYVASSMILARRLLISDTLQVR